MVPITMLYVGILAIWLIFLAALVVRSRLQTKTDLGAGEAMEQVVRAHGNAVEYVPLCLLALGVLELNGASSTLLHILGIVLVISRLAHAQGLLSSRGTTPGRLLGTVGTWTVQLVAGGWCLYLFFVAS